jgi:hypothetical protein
MNNKFGWVLTGLIIGSSGAVIWLITNNVLGQWLAGVGLGWVSVSSFMPEPSQKNRRGGEG